MLQGLKDNFAACVFCFFLTGSAKFDSMIIKSNAGRVGMQSLCLIKVGKEWVHAYEAFSVEGNIFVL